MSFSQGLVNFILTMLRTSTPILYVALGILIMHLSGVMNIGAEGMMLMGSFAGFAGTVLLGNVWLGAVFAMLITGIFSMLFALFAITLRANQVVVGVAFNILASGITTVLFRITFGVNSTPVKVQGFAPIFQGLSLPVFLGIAIALFLFWYLKRTKFGLKIRAVGENPLAVDTVGLSVSKIRYISIFIGAMLIGFGGAFLSTGALSFFTEDNTASRGYIALAAVTFGKYNPVGILLAVWVFGMGDAVQYTLQAVGSVVPYQFVQMIPYLLTIVTLVLFVKKSGEPAALGKAYNKN